jgi:hypothetical protein
MADASLNVLGIHGGIDECVRFINGNEGTACLDAAKSAGIEVEYELHALGWLLPRAIFGEHPEWFRLDEHGERVADANMCASSAEALQYVGERGVELSDMLTPTTNRYYYWADDAKPWCACEGCREYSASDQNLLVTNALTTALTWTKPGAKMAYLAYHNAIEPPTRVQPVTGQFLEYAPIMRNSAVPLDDPSDPKNVEHAENLRCLVATFDTVGGMADAHVLEYWVDASRFSDWKRPSVRIPFDADVIEQDARYYASLGFRSATSFGVFLDAEYDRMHGPPPIREYGEALTRVS